MRWSCCPSRDISVNISIYFRPENILSCSTKQSRNPHFLTCWMIYSTKWLYILYHPHIDVYTASCMFQAGQVYIYLYRGQAGNGFWRSCLWLFIAISLISMCVVIARFQQEPNSHSRVPFCTRSRPLYTCRMMVMAANWMDGEGAFCIVWLVYHWVMGVLLWLSVCFMCRGGSFFSMRLHAKSGKL